MLLCVHSAASSEIVLETLEAHGPARHSRAADRRARARRAAARRRHAACCTCRRRGPTRLRFLAGQSVTLSAAAGGTEAQATYAIASCPCDERNLHFHVGRDDGDAFARLLFDGALATGSTLTLAGPVGDFVFWESDRRLAFLACDTGFAPIKSLIEHAMAVDAAESLALGWLATRPDGHYLANQCRAWAEAFDQFRYVACTDADPAAGAVRLVGAMAAARPLAALRRLCRGARAVRGGGRGQRCGPPACPPGRSTRRSHESPSAPSPFARVGTHAMTTRRIIPVVADAGAGDCSGRGVVRAAGAGRQHGARVRRGRGHRRRARRARHRRLVRRRAGRRRMDVPPARRDRRMAGSCARSIPPTRRPRCADLAAVRGVVIQKSRPGRRRALKRYVD